MLCSSRPRAARHLVVTVKSAAACLGRGTLGPPPGKEARTATVRVPCPTLSTERPPREGDYLESVAAAPAPSAKAHF